MKYAEPEHAKNLVLLPEEVRNSAVCFFLPNIEMLLLVVEANASGLQKHIARFLRLLKPTFLKVIVCIFD